MIKNFDKVKQQLQELAPVINSFKSETVQLRVVELIFQGEGDVDDTPSPEGRTERAKAKPKTEQKSRSKAKPKHKTSTDKAETKSTAKGGSGAHAAVSLLLDEGFFKKPQSIRSIIVHLGTNKGRHFKANQISPSLLRLLREDKLKRAKNADNQYEYSEA